MIITIDYNTIWVVVSLLILFLLVAITFQGIVIARLKKERSSFKKITYSSVENLVSLLFEKTEFYKLEQKHYVYYIVYHLFKKNGIDIDEGSLCIRTPYPPQKRCREPPNQNELDTK